MAVEKAKQIRVIRILLTVFDGFLLSNILFRYIIHENFETIRRPASVYAITVIVLGTLILIPLILGIYATWFDSIMILLVSGIVLIVTFFLILVWGILRIIEKTPYQADRSVSKYEVAGAKNRYDVVEDVTKLSIELIVILFTILGTFILYHYIKTKYASVPTAEPKAA